MYCCMRLYLFSKVYHLHTKHLALDQSDRNPLLYLAVSLSLSLSLALSLCACIRTHEKLKNNLGNMLHTHSFAVSVILQRRKHANTQMDMCALKYTHSHLKNLVDTTSVYFILFEFERPFDINLSSKFPNATSIPIKYFKITHTHTQQYRISFHCT